MRQAKEQIVVATRGQSLLEITPRVRPWVEAQGIGEGLLTLFLHHTSASLLIQENADPDVQRDLIDFFRALVPEDPKRYRHGAEGPDDMPAHIRAALTATQLSIPVAGGGLELGRWQGIYLFEHRARPHERRITLYLAGE